RSTARCRWTAHIHTSWRRASSSWHASTLRARRGPIHPNETVKVLLQTELPFLRCDLTRNLGHAIAYAAWASVRRHDDRPRGSSCAARGEGVATLLPVERRRSFGTRDPLDRRTRRSRVRDPARRRAGVSPRREPLRSRGEQGGRLRRDAGPRTRGAPVARPAGARRPLPDHAALPAAHRPHAHGQGGDAGPPRGAGRGRARRRAHLPWPRPARLLRPPHDHLV